jgi:hypothetical protein
VVTKKKEDKGVRNVSFDNVTEREMMREERKEESEG